MLWGSCTILSLLCVLRGGIFRRMAIIDFRRPIVLATASEARRALVSDAGIKFVADVVEIDESARPGEDVGDYVTRLSTEKANCVIPPTLDAVIITVDTAIGLEGEIIGKPRNEVHAREILERFSGKTHEVVSAITIRDIDRGTLDTSLTRTFVKFVKLDRRTIDWYLDTGEWRGRAGAYAIQGKGAALIEEVRGCFTNVIGISMPALIMMLRQVR